MQGITNSIINGRQGFYCWKNIAKDQYYYTLTEHPQVKDLIVQLPLNGPQKGLINKNTSLESTGLNRRYVMQVNSDGTIRSRYNKAVANDVYARYPDGDWIPDYDATWEELDTIEG